MYDLRARRGAARCGAAGRRPRGAGTGAGGPDAAGGIAGRGRRRAPPGAVGAGLREHADDGLRVAHGAGAGAGGQARARAAHERGHLCLLVRLRLRAQRGRRRHARGARGARGGERQQQRQRAGGGGAPHRDGWAGGRGARRLIKGLARGAWSARTSSRCARTEGRVELLGSRCQCGGRPEGGERSAARRGGGGCAGVCRAHVGGRRAPVSRCPHGRRRGGPSRGVR